MNEISSNDPASVNAKELAEECKQFADELAQMRAKRIFWNRVIRAGLTLIGLASILAAYVPEITVLIGPDPQQKIALVAAVALIVSALGPILISSEPPERFADYSHYILTYHAKIKQTFASHQLDADQKRHQLFELTNIARSNLDDVRNKWPRAAERVDARMSRGS